MLSKVKTDTLIVLWEQIYYKESQSVSSGSSGTVYDLTTITTAGDYYFSMDIHSTGSGNCYGTLYKGSATTANVILSGGKSGSGYDYKSTVTTITANTVIKLKGETWNTGGYIENITICKALAVTPSDTIGIKPRELENIWNLGIGTLYGVHTDNVYYGGLMMDKTSTATTGSVTLGNAVGYIKVNFNGEIVKIPYYWN